MMKRSRVALVRCESYAADEVLNAISSGISLLGGVSEFVKPGERIVLKPNILVGSKPEQGVTTHPVVFKAVGQMLKNAGVDVCYGDSPGFGKCQSQAKNAGLKQAADELGIGVVDFDSGRQVSHGNALLVKVFMVANGVLDTDGLVSLPKFKTHGLVRFTGAVKNQFGCVPGFLKGQYHMKLPDLYNFATMLVDLNTLIKPRFYIMDGIMAMEGNGPRGGKMRNLKILLFSRDPVALDATACRIINLDPEVVPTSKPGEKAGLGTYHAENIDLLGEPLESFFEPDFDVIRTAPVSCNSGRLRTLVRNQLCERPVIDNRKCTLCGTCTEICPVEPKAVNWNGGNDRLPPSYNYDLCIRCYCCQEMCPEGAISTQSPLLGKLLARL